MKKATSEAIVFQPSILVHDHNSCWVISFDSGSNRDMKRESRSLWVKKEGITQLDVQVEGFDHLADPTDTTDERGIAGRIQLVVTYSGGATDSRLLAECALSPWAQHRALKAGSAVPDVAAAVRNGTAAAFTEVLPNLFVSMSVTRLTERVADEVVKRTGAERPRSSGQVAQSQARLQRWKPWLAAGSAVVVLWAILAIAGKPAQPSQSAQASTAAASPELQALLQNQALQQPSVDPQAQVELVKSTLKSMGLNPGASGDTGCLVQPH